MDKISLVVTTVLVGLPGVQAWVSSTSKPIRLSRTVLQMSSEETMPSKGSFSRRNWLSAVSSAGCALVPRLANAEAPVYTQKVPVSTSSTCNPSVSVWNQPSTGRKVYLLGTAHISAESAVLAGQVVQDVHPEAVFVELDAKRVKRAGVATAGPAMDATSDNSRERFEVPENTEAGPSTPALATTTSSSSTSNSKMNGVTAAAVGTAIKGMYKKLDSQGFQAGEEFVVAVKEGYKVGARIILGDRDVEVTLRRLSEAIGKTDIRKLLSQDSEMEKTLAQLVPAKKIPNEEDPDYKEQLTFYVENMKAKENVKLLMAQLKRVAPEIYEAMVHERDEYMGNGLDRLSIFPNIVAVMGMAHVDGVETYLQKRGWRQVPLMCRG